MRPLLAIAVATVASCAPPPAPVSFAPQPQAAPGQERFLDQGWSAADRQRFETTSQGSYLMPFAWFQALRQPGADDAFTADSLQRYGYLPSANSLLPIGFVRDGTAAEPHVGMTCAACHTGQLRAGGQVWRIDGGRARADFQAFLTGLGAATRATLADENRFRAFAHRVLGPAATPAAIERLRTGVAAWSRQWDGFMAASLPDPAWGAGRLDAFGMIFNRVTGLDLGFNGNFAKADAPVRYPFIWDAPRQDRTQWTGAAPNGTYLRGLARNTGEVFGVFGRFSPLPVPINHAIYRNAVNLPGLQALEEKVVALRAPPWPKDVLPLDPARVARGEQLFASECSGCHAKTPSRLVRNAWNTEIRAVGTDPRTFDNAHRMGSPRALTGTQQPPVVGERLTDPAPKLAILANAVTGSLLRGVLLRDAGVRRAIERDFAEDRLPVPGGSPAPGPAVTSATKDLYKLAGPAPDTVPGVAYEARVLTGIWAVGPYLHNGSVASLWELLKPACDRRTRFAVGHADFDPVHVGLETDATLGRAIFVVDPATGNGNGGHEFGVTLPEADRWALVEYLKTL